MKSVLASIAFLGSVSAASAGAIDDFNRDTVVDLFSPSLFAWGYLEETPYVYEHSYDSVCNADDGHPEKALIFGGYSGAGFHWLPVNTTRSCSKAGAYDPVFGGSN